MASQRSFQSPWINQLIRKGLQHSIHLDDSFDCVQTWMGSRAHRMAIERGGSLWQRNKGSRIKQQQRSTLEMGSLVQCSTQRASTGRDASQLQITWMAHNNARGRERESPTHCSRIKYTGIRHCIVSAQVIDSGHTPSPHFQTSITLRTESVDYIYFVLLLLHSWRDKRCYYLLLTRHWVICKVEYNSFNATSELKSINTSLKMYCKEFSTNFFIRVEF